MTLLIAGNVGAQQTVPSSDASATRLDRIQVTGAQTPSKTALSPDPASLPGSTTVVTQAEIAKLSVVSYGDLLRPVTGLNINNFGLGGLGYGFSLRGFVDTEHGKDVAVFVDGVPSNVSAGLQANGYVDLNPLLPETIASFEVLRGPVSALYGNHALGGTIAFKTLADAPPSRIDLSGGSYSSGRALGLLGFQGNGFAGYSALEGYTTDGYRDNARDRRVNTFNKISFPMLSGTGSLRLQLFNDSYGESGYLIAPQSSRARSTREPRSTAPTTACISSRTWSSITTAAATTSGHRPPTWSTTTCSAHGPAAAMPCPVAVPYSGSATTIACPSAGASRTRRRSRQWACRHCSSAARVCMAT